MPEHINTLSPWRRKLHEVIFEADTPAGKLFDVALLAAIVISIIAVSLETVQSYEEKHGPTLRAIEWMLTIAFTIEYVLRLLCVRRPARYAVSFFGIVDLLAILPTYISVLIPGAQSLLVIRGLRLLRVFRVFKLAHFLGEAQVLGTALRNSARKVIIFFGTVVTLVFILGTFMYLIEGGEEDTGFTSIPESVYWAIVTMTTVGFGDITPQTPQGKFLASCIMIIGYAIIAVPTGIVTAELTLESHRTVTTQSCPGCMREGHDRSAVFCKFCGERLNP